MNSNSKQSGDSNTELDIKILEAIEKEIETIIMNRSMKKDFDKLKKDYPLIMDGFILFPADELSDEVIDVILNKESET